TGGGPCEGSKASALIVSLPWMACRRLNGARPAAPPRRGRDGPRPSLHAMATHPELLQQRHAPRLRALHDARARRWCWIALALAVGRSEEHTSELQSREKL